MNTKTKLIQYAALLERIRGFFTARKVLEVTTPLLRANSVTDPNIESLNVNMEDKAFWLQTSPEYAMKQLLVEYPTDLYQICKAFRKDPNSRWHRTEFTLLEWYRIDWNMHQLMQEVSALIVFAAQETVALQQLTYQDAFQQFAGCNPQQTPTHQLKQCYFDLGGTPVKGVDDSDHVLWEQLLLTEIIEPQLPFDKLTFITHFPKSLASLAKIDPLTQEALRFECYWKGVELAHGYEEMSDAANYRSRFEQDNQMRRAKGQHPMPIDQPFLDSLTANPLPECSGVALGIDRLFALILNQNALLTEP